MTRLAEKLFEGNLADGAGDRAVVNDGRLTAVAAVNVSVHAVVASVHLAANEPETHVQSVAD